MLLLDLSEYSEKRYELKRAIQEVQMIYPNLAVTLKYITINVTKNETGHTNVIIIGGDFKQQIKTITPFENKTRKSTLVAGSIMKLTKERKIDYVISELTFLHHYSNVKVFGSIASFMRETYGVNYPETEHASPLSATIIAEFCNKLDLYDCDIKNIGKLCSLPMDKMLAVVRQPEFEKKTGYRFNLWLYTFEKISDFAIGG